MVKAKLIENERYYKLRREQMLLILITWIPIGIIGHLFKIPFNLGIVSFGIYLLVVILLFRNKKLMHLIIGNKIIEIDEEEIRIKSKKGIRLEVIKLAEIDKIILKKDYFMPQEPIKAIGHEIKGNTPQNFIILQKNKEERKLYFEFDSYYMLEQMNKMINKWEEKAYILERIA